VLLDSGLAAYSANRNAVEKRRVAPCVPLPMLWHAVFFVHTFPTERSIARLAVFAGSRKISCNTWSSSRAALRTGMLKAARP
jgi:hypothetical protein